jgi:hypothetical protein
MNYKIGNENEIKTTTNYCYLILSNVGQECSEKFTLLSIDPPPPATIEDIEYDTFALLNGRAGPDRLNTKLEDYKNEVFRIAIFENGNKTITDIIDFGYEKLREIASFMHKYKDCDLFSTFEYLRGYSDCFSANSPCPEIVKEFKQRRIHFNAYLTLAEQRVRSFIRENVSDTKILPTYLKHHERQRLVNCDTTIEELKKKKKNVDRQHYVCYYLKSIDNKWKSIAEFATALELGIIYFNEYEKTCTENNPMNEAGFDDYRKAEYNKYIEQAGGNY